MIKNTITLSKNYRGDWCKNLQRSQPISERVLYLQMLVRYECLHICIELLPSVVPVQLTLLQKQRGTSFRSRGTICVLQFGPILREIILTACSFQITQQP